MRISPFSFSRAAGAFASTLAIAGAVGLVAVAATRAEAQQGPSTPAAPGGSPSTPSIPGQQPPAAPPTTKPTSPSSPPGVPAPSPPAPGVPAPSHGLPSPTPSTGAPTTPSSGSSSAPTAPDSSMASTPAPASGGGGAGAAGGPAVPVAGVGDEPYPAIGDARPALPPPAEPIPVAWHNHIEVGAGLAVSELPAHLDGYGKATPMRFDAAAGFHLDLSWQLLRYLRLTGYLSEHDHSLQIPAGSVGVTCPANASGSTSCITGSDAHIYSFGLRLSPTLPLGKRVRLWLTGGVGWGRIEYPRYTVEAAVPYTIDYRSESFFEIPLGLGGSVEIIPRWLSLHIEATGSFLPSQIGDALQKTQAINGTTMGTMDIGPMPKLDAAFLETIGLSLHL